MRQRLILLISATTIVASSAAAWAVMPPAVYKQAAKSAAHHVQVKVLEVKAPAKGPGECAIKAQLVTIFRDKSKKMKKGQKLSFSISCMKEGDAQPPPGGTIWKHYEQLRKAKFLEVALNSDSALKRFSVARWNSSIIAKPSKKPQYGFPFQPAKKKSR